MIAFVNLCVAEVPRWMRGSRPYRIEREDEFQVELDRTVSHCDRLGLDVVSELGLGMLDVSE